MGATFNAKAAGDCTARDAASLQNSCEHHIFSGMIFLSPSCSCERARLPDLMVLCEETACWPRCFNQTRLLTPSPKGHDGALLVMGIPRCEESPKPRQLDSWAEWNICSRSSNDSRFVVVGGGVRHVRTFSDLRSSRRFDHQLKEQNQHHHEYNHGVLNQHQDLKQMIYQKLMKKLKLKLIFLYQHRG